jgi:hypothetical protein
MCGLCVTLQCRLGCSAAAPVFHTAGAWLSVVQHNQTSLNRSLTMVCSFMGDHAGCCACNLPSAGLLLSAVFHHLQSLSLCAMHNVTAQYSMPPLYFTGFSRALFAVQ